MLECWLLLTALYSLVGLEERTEWRRVSLLLASSCAFFLTADRRAPEAAVAEALAAARARGEAREEERRAFSPRCSTRAACCSEAMSVLWKDRGFGFADSWMVLKEVSAARRRASLVESMRMEVRAGEDGEVRVSWRSGRVEERRDW